jgi:phospholipid/cholesterol/gamma-HCH transport system substrate-binding protein
MQSNLVETLIGAIVLAVAGVFFFFAYGIVGAGGSDGTKLIARFDRIDGISVGSDVRMSGIKIGTVSNLNLDPPPFYTARVELSVSESVQLPDDSSIKITSDGLLGGAYLSLEAGGSETLLANGGEIKNTQGSIDLIGLISRAVFSGGSEEEKKTPPEGQPQEP